MKEIRIVHFGKRPFELNVTGPFLTVNGPVCGPHRFRTIDFGAHYITGGCFYSGEPYGRDPIGPGELVVDFPHTNACTGSAKGHSLFHWHFDFGSIPIHRIGTSLEEWGRIVSETSKRTGHFADTLIIPDRLRIEDGREVENLLQSIMNGQSSNAPGAQIAAKARMILLLQKISEETLKLLIGKHVKGIKNRYGLHVSRALSHVESRISEPLSPNHLAHELQINPDYLGRIFKKTMGQSLGTYIQRRRMALAEELLTNSRLRIKEIAGRCGYSDALYFSRTFRRIYGMSPTEYILRNTPEMGGETN